MSKLNFNLLLITFLTSFQVSFAQQSKVLSYDEEVFFDGKKLRTTYTQKVLVSKKSDHEVGDLFILYSLGEDIVIHDASITDVKGNKIRSIKRKDFKKTNAVMGSVFHDDTYLLCAQLKTNQYPHIVNFSYTITTRNILYLANWFATLDYHEVPTLKSTLKVTYPLDFPINVSADEQFEFSESSDSEFKTLIWKLKDEVKYVEEKNSPNIRNSFPSVSIVPETYSYGVTSKVTNWKEYGDWVYLLNSGLDDLTEEEKIKIHQLTDSIDDPKEKVKVLYNYMQDHTRYINVALGIGGLKPHPASYVCKNKYGDCKALTNYMHSMLNEIGISSYPIDVFAGDNPYEIDTTFPAQQFNHVFLGVVVENDTIFLENTSKTAPFNYLGTFTQNRKGLWVEKGKSKLIDLPTLTRENTEDSISYIFSLPNEEQVREVNINLTSSGGDLFEMLNHYSDAGSEKQEKILRKHVLPFELSDIDNIQIKNEDRNTAFITASFKGDYSKLEREIAGFEVITPPSIINTKIEKPSERFNPYIINVVIHKKEHFEFPLENIEKLTVELPEDYHLQSKYGEYKDHFYIKEGKVYLDRSIYVKPVGISLEDYPEFYNFYKAINKRSKQSSIIIKQQT
ncbi:DUF3857 domain-containing protein [Flammeovirga sp. SJP92]|uniref:DUF3857 domain-containing protein n=1 Tax=Flammeovirga sp. SJP92 TaxID=1775430 RepID=UPI0007893041|nr:DUF3857 domain-containing protein [Flammeovirga sp. SJP92]KXX70320.1 hypothetical protein AVL50_11990 [Flammeovirga sp. SJP92]